MLKDKRPDIEIVGDELHPLLGVYAVVACAHLFDESAGYQTYARIERADSG